MATATEGTNRRIRVTEVADADLPVLANLYQFYRYDLAATRGAAGYDLLPEGRYAVPSYLASVGADMLDYFILGKYRGQGVGTVVARSLFDRYPGRWEVRAHALNGAAQRFWRRVIAAYTGGRYTERTWDDARHRGIVFGFATAGSTPTSETTEHAP